MSATKRSSQVDPMLRVLNRHTDAIPPGAVYVGRPTKWGNPYQHGRGLSRAEVVLRYRTHLLANDELMRALPELRGRDLVCSCPPSEPCHAMVLLELANASQRVKGKGVRVKRQTRMAEDELRALRKFVRWFLARYCYSLGVRWPCLECGRAGRDEPQLLLKITRSNGTRYKTGCHACNADDMIEEAQRLASWPD